jgi:hypothetical protein
VCVQLVAAIRTLDKAPLPRAHLQAQHGKCSRAADARGTDAGRTRVRRTCTRAPAPCGRCPSGNTRRPCQALWTVARRAAKSSPHRGPRVAATSPCRRATGRCPAARRCRQLGGSRGRGAERGWQSKVRVRNDERHAQRPFEERVLTPLQRTRSQ